MEKVIPTSLNYADIKPEAIENSVKLVRFTPTANVTNSKPNDVVRFNIQGNGFLDPRSAYIVLDVDFLLQNVNDFSLEDPAKSKTGSIANSGKTLIQAAKCLDRSAHSFFERFILRSQGTELERIEQYDVMAAMVNDMVYSFEQKTQHHFEGFPTKSLILNNNLNQFMPSELAHCGDIGFHVYTAIPDSNTYDTIDQNGNVSGTVDVVTGFTPQSIFTNQGLDVLNDMNGQTYLTNSNGPAIQLVANNNTEREQLIQAISQVEPTLRFCIPIYSGLMGVMIPDKKLIPLSLLPLEVEFGLNPYALYAFGGFDRTYEIKKFEIFAHVLYFEQDVHRSLLQVVAQQGIFIHFNVMYLAPITVNAGAAMSSVNQFAQINVHFKSITAVHFCFMYQGFESNPAQRKLCFVSHGIKELQLRNGTELIPSEPIRGDMFEAAKGRHSTFLVETYKSWNKMHDPATDSSLAFQNYATDSESSNFYGKEPIQDFHLRQCLLGRTQYGISLEGEELGKDKTTITGRKGMTPFDINMVGSKPLHSPSYTVPFVRADMIVYVRPDLVVTVLGM